MKLIKCDENIVIHMVVTVDEGATLSINVDNAITMRLDYGIRFDFAGAIGKNVEHLNKIVASTIKRNDGKPVIITSAMFRDFKNEGIYHCYIKMSI
jgi:hypothetical protein